jgi:TonB-dependent starch-binding outer membrane protein SusC
MKLLILYCIASLASVSACAQRIGIPPGKLSLRNLISLTQKQTAYSFVYASSQLKSIPDRYFTKDSIDLFESIGNFLQGTTLNYSIEEYKIILVPSMNSQYVLSGKIVYPNGTPVAGATIQTALSEQFAITDRNGKFQLQNITIPVNITISGAEIETKECSIRSLAGLEIEVHEMIKELDETIILGYSSTTKRFNTGNAISIRGENIERQPASDLAGSLQGRVPGLLITSSGGAPSASYRMQIRGQHSINPNPLINYLVPPVDQPLIIINGIPLAPQNNNINQLPSVTAPGNLEIYQNPYGGISALSMIDPADIKSIEVLKDAVTTSIYGSRAANGIIIITTRHSSVEDFQVETSFSAGLNFILKRPAMQSTSSFLELREAAFRSDNLQPNLEQNSLFYAPDLLLFDRNRDINWHRQLFHTAVPTKSIRSRISLKAGNITFTSSAGYREEQHALKGNFYSQQLSGNHSFRYGSGNKRLSVAASVYYTHGRSYSAAAPLLLQSISLPPNYPALYNEQKEINWEYLGIEMRANPAGLLLQTYNTRLNNLVTSLKTAYLISSKLTARINTGFSGFTMEETSAIPHSSVPENNYTHVRSVFANSRFETILAEPQLEYKTDVQRLSIQTLIGSSFQHHKIYYNSKKGTGYLPGTSLNTLNAAARVDERYLNDNYEYESFFGLINLRYAQRYLIHFSTRQENSSRFTSGDQSGLFISTGIGWIFSDEIFIRHQLKWLSFGKIRFSYGTTGNDNIGYNHFLDAWSRAASYTGNQARIDGVTEIPFSWSQTTKAEGGIELHFIDDLLSFTASHYRHHSSRQLISQFNTSQPGIRYITNFDAVVQNTGWEFTTAVHSSKTTKIRWSCQINMTLPNNKLSGFPGLNNSLYAGRYWVGESLNAKRVIAYNGVDAETGLYAFNEEKISFINETPRAYGGISGNLWYRKWNATVAMEFREQTGTNIFKQVHIVPPGRLFNMPAIVNDHWRFTGDQAMFQQPAIQLNPSVRKALSLLTISDAQYSSASFLRVKDLTIGYRIREAHNDRAFVKTMEMYLQAQNFLTITSMKVLDPEIRSLYTYPFRGNISIGLTIKI